VYRSRRDRNVVAYCRNGLPRRQRRHALSVERHNDRITGSDRRGAGLRHLPARAGGINVPVGVHHVGLLVIGKSRHIAAQVDVIVAPEVGLMQVRDPVLHLASGRDLLLLCLESSETTWDLDRLPTLIHCACD
jgi:hypothetical protein